MISRRGVGDEVGPALPWTWEAIIKLSSRAF